jgi:hypothetical protein
VTADITRILSVLVTRRHLDIAYAAAATHGYLRLLPRGGW